MILRSAQRSSAGSYNPRRHLDCEAFGSRQPRKQYDVARSSVHILYSRKENMVTRAMVPRHVPQINLRVPLDASPAHSHFPVSQGRDIRTALPSRAAHAVPAIMRAHKRLLPIGTGEAQISMPIRAARCRRCRTRTGTRSRWRRTAPTPTSPATPMPPARRRRSPISARSRRPRRSARSPICC